MTLNFKVNTWGNKILEIQHHFISFYINDLIFKEDCNYNIDIKMKLSCFKDHTLNILSSVHFSWETAGEKQYLNIHVAKGV